MAYNMTGFEVQYSLVDQSDESPLVSQDTDTLNNTWFRSQPGFGARAKPSLVESGGNIYMWGGYQFPDDSTEALQIDYRMWKYSDNKWKPIEPTNENIPVRYSGAMVALDSSSLVLYGGVRYAPNYEVLSDMWHFDLETNTFSTIEIDSDQKPIPNSGHSLVKEMFT